MATINGQTEAVQANITPTNTIAPMKHPLPPAKTVDSQSVLRRLQSELMALMMGGDSGISAFPEEENIFYWKGTITGIKDTVFEGTEYKLSLSFPHDYPFKPPKVKFETTCFHPNVDLHGNMCLDILRDKWPSANDVRTILLSIQSLHGEPNNSSPLNPQAAQLWSNQEEYRKMVEKLYKSPKVLRWVLECIIPGCVEGSSLCFSFGEEEGRTQFIFRCSILLFPFFFLMGIFLTFIKHCLSPLF